MKTITSVKLAAVSIVFVACRIWAQSPLVGNELEIGPLLSDQVRTVSIYYQPYSGAIGSGNTVTGGLAVGLANYNFGDYYAGGKGSFVIGRSNSINFAESFVVGRSNQFIWGYRGFQSGAQHYISGNDDFYQYVPNYSFINGMAGSIYNTKASFLSGINNVMAVFNELPGGAALGRGLVGVGDGGLVVGRYNLYLQPSAFTVGNGQGPYSRSDALRVKGDGSISLGKRQGDILMGEFGHPE